MEKTMALMNQKITEPDTGDSAQGPLALPAASWIMSDRYAKHHILKTQK